jgi:hydroxypyruvate isomerase
VSWQNNSFETASLFLTILTQTKPMNRKTFIKNSVIAGGSIVTPTLLSAQLNKHRNNTANENTFHCNYAPHEGMFKNNAGSDFLDQIKFAYR